MLIITNFFTTTFLAMDSLILNNNHSTKPLFFFYFENFILKQSNIYRISCAPLTQRLFFLRKRKPSLFLQIIIIVLNSLSTVYVGNNESFKFKVLFCFFKNNYFILLIITIISIIFYLIFNLVFRRKKKLKPHQIICSL